MSPAPVVSKKLSGIGKKGLELFAERPLSVTRRLTTPRYRKGRMMYAPNISVYDHERDAELAHRFLAEKGFIIARNRRGDGNS